MDADTGRFYFIEVNPRVQVEHTVTEEVTGIDIVKAQIRIAAGAMIGEPASGVPVQEEIRLNGHALQCRITTEDPEQNFIPDYGRITAYRGATGFGIRLDGGTAYSGAVITRFYDPLLEKVTAWAPTAEEAAQRMDRALREFRIRGVATNLVFLENVIGHPDFRANSYTTRFIDETPALFHQVTRRDRATKLLTYIADVTVNGHPETRNRPQPLADAPAPAAPVYEGEIRKGTKQLLDELGPQGFADWMKAERRALVTDTTMRDAHQSLLATRMRSFDIVAVADSYARGLPQLFSLECWGGATFDVAMRFLTEDPWERLRAVRERVPNILLQMLLRGANGVGYANYPDNVVRDFVARAAENGIDLFRVFDCLNWVENMRVSLDAVIEADKLCEGTICYTGDLLDAARPKYDLAYYVKLAKELERAGCHILGVKDMAGLMKPEAARRLFSALKQEVGLPIHFHTHDTSGISAATVLAAVEAGVDAVDAAMDAFSGLTSQPALGSLAAALRDGPRDTGLDARAIREISFYWEAARAQYRAFESDLKAPASEVYLHEMPGGQFTNLKEQARSLGLETRWHEVAQPITTSHDVRRHRQGDPVVQGRRRHGVDDGGAGPVGRRCDGSGEGCRLPRQRCADDARRSRPVARRMAEGHPVQGAEGRDADHRASRFAAGGRRSCRPPQGSGGKDRRRDLRHRSRLLPDVSEGLHRFCRRKGSLRSGQRAADAGLLLRPAGRRGDDDRSGAAARRWSYAPRPSAKRTRTASARCSSSSTASRASSRCRTGRMERPGPQRGARSKTAMPLTSARRCRASSRLLR